MPAVDTGSLPTVTASIDGSLCYHHLGTTAVNVNYDFILAKLLCFLGSNSSFPQATSSSLLPSTQYLTSHCKHSNFDVNAHLEWYYDFYLQNRMHVYQYLKKLAVLDYLTRWYHAEMDLSFFNQGRLDGFIFDFGHQRLGGVFLSFDPTSKTIAIDYPFIRCDAKRSNFLMRLLAHFVRTKYSRYEKIKRVIPSFLAKYFEPLLVSTKVERIEDVGAALGFAPGVLIQYTWQISELLKLLA